MKIKGKNFVKSSYRGGSNCVGVAIEKGKISVVNTKDKNTILTFTNAEWIAFIKGVKNEEFNIEECKPV